MLAGIHGGSADPHLLNKFPACMPSQPNTDTERPAEHPTNNPTRRWAKLPGHYFADPKDYRQGHSH